jgi:phage repressor protein C with HTH and peptisase S24 domain
MEFKDRLKMARQHGQLTQTELAKAVGISQTSITDLERGKSQSTSYVAEIAKACSVDPLWLATGKGQMTSMVEVKHYSGPTEAEMDGPIEVWDDDTPLGDDVVALPFLKEVELAAGAGRTAVEVSTNRRLRFGKYSLKKENVQAESAFAVTVRGNSMEPVLPDGATVAVNCSDTRITDGKTYAIDHGGQLRVKLLYRLPGGGVRVRSYNRDEHADEDYTLEQLEAQHFRIIGRVFWAGMYF